MDDLLSLVGSLKKGGTAEVELDAIGSWPKTRHVAERDDLLAMIAAMGSKRALLLTGAPGVGKSHLARVAAALTGRYFVSTVIKPDDEISDLLWSIDHTQRLADAQLAGALKKEFNKPLEDYLRPGPVWHAFEAPSNEITSHYQPPQQQAQRENGVVLLIDEIDKASVNLMNSLLEVLGNMSFEVPILKQPVQSLGKPPLVILTSNGERPLPPALLRRCVTHSVTLPKDEKAFIERMNLIAKAQMKDEKQDYYSKDVAYHCAQLIHKQRNTGAAYKPGASEFVDLIQALHAIAPDDEQAQLNQHLPDIQSYFIKPER